MLDKVKLALRLTGTAYDDEINQLIAAGIADLGLLGIPANLLTDDALVVRAVITYCRVHFGSPNDYDRIKASYDEQKAQLLGASGYGFENGDDCDGSCGCNLSHC